MFKSNLHPMPNREIFHLAKFLIVIIIFASCSKKESTVPVPTTDTTNKLGIIVSNTFNYQTAVSTTLDISLLANDNKPLAGVMVTILDKSLDEGGKVMYTAVSDAGGKIGGSIKMPSYLKTVIVDPGYIGLIHNAAVKIEGNKVLCTLCGSAGYLGNVIPNGRVAASSSNAMAGGRKMAETYKYLGKYNGNGKPDYLLPENDKISESTLSDINASLPEYQSVEKLHPEYMKEDAKTSLDIKEASDVWITFVYEGTKYQNSLAYFTYPTGKKPKSTKEIETLTIILPNASLSGSGGELTSGNRVNIGKFDAGTFVGFCLVVNGWNKDKNLVDEGSNKFYSIDLLNPETAEKSKRHVVLLKDEKDKLIMIGIEGLDREKGSDHDFNDIIFYATTTAATDISTGEMEPIDSKEDSDGDGIADNKDMFPKDALRALVNYYPDSKSYASIAFEDTWPSTGDYDMNDMVVDCQYASVQNAKNQTVELYANYIPRASGASFKNGFGVQFPFSPKMVASVTGSRVTDKSVVVINSNGCEAEQSKAVIIPFDDIYAIMLPDGKTYINTQPGVGYIKPETITMKVSFNSPVSPDEIGAAPFNQFLISNKTRGKEVHLPGELPTDKVNTALFNTLQDNTIRSENRYYRTGKNLPFAISIPQSFDYPFEGKMITNTYLKFAEWAQSGGTTSADWYLDINGYRNTGFIYK